MDATGTTVRDYSVGEYPTLVLIDPQGRIVEIGNETVLKRLLKRLEKEIAVPKE